VDHRRPPPRAAIEAPVGRYVNKPTDPLDRVPVHPERPDSRGEAELRHACDHVVPIGREVLQHAAEPSAIGRLDPAASWRRSPAAERLGRPPDLLPGCRIEHVTRNWSTTDRRGGEDHLGGALRDRAPPLARLAPSLVVEEPTQLIRRGSRDRSGGLARRLEEVERELPRADGVTMYLLEAATNPGLLGGLARFRRRRLSRGCRQPVQASTRAQVAWSEGSTCKR